MAILYRAARPRRGLLNAGAISGGGGLLNPSAFAQLVISTRFRISAPAHPMAKPHAFGDPDKREPCGILDPMPQRARCKLRRVGEGVRGGAYLRGSVFWRCANCGSGDISILYAVNPPSHTRNRDIWTGRISGSAAPTGAYKVNSYRSRKGPLS